MTVYRRFLITGVRARSRGVACDVCVGQSGRGVNCLSEYFIFRFIIPFFRTSFHAGTVVRSFHTPRIAGNERGLLLLFDFVENDLSTLYNVVYTSFVR